MTKLSNFKKVKISAINTVVPEKEINIYDEIEYYGNSVKKVDRMRKMVGFYKRRVVDDIRITPADLAYDAALTLIKENNIDKNSIDALVFVVQQPDVINPSTAYFIHNKLGLSNDCIATDINQGCVGWVFGLFMASQMIQSGTFKKVLLLNGDIPSVGIDLSNRNSAPIFGDGGTATLLEYCETEINSSYCTETVSSGCEALITPFGAARFGIRSVCDADNKITDKLKEKLTMPTGASVSLLDSYMDGVAVFDFTMNYAPKTIKKILEFNNLTPDDIPYLCLHQANKQIIQTVGTVAGFPLEKVPYSAFETYGNNTMCSIPITLSMLPKETDMSKTCCCAFGNGLISMAAILNLSNTRIGEIKTFKKPSCILSKDEYINYWRKKIKGEIDE